MPIITSNSTYGWQNPRPLVLIGTLEAHLASVNTLTDWLAVLPGGPRNARRGWKQHRSLWAQKEIQHITDDLRFIALLGHHFFAAYGRHHDGFHIESWALRCDVFRSDVMLQYHRAAVQVTDEVREREASAVGYRTG